MVRAQFRSKYFVYFTKSQINQGELNNFLMISMLYCTNDYFIWNWKRDNESIMSYLDAFVLVRVTNSLVYYFKRHWHIFSMNHSDYILKTFNSADVCIFQLDLFFNLYSLLHFVLSCAIRSHDKTSKFSNIDNLIWFLLICLLFDDMLFFIIIGIGFLLFLFWAMKALFLLSLPIF